ncbi:uncharacterized protein PFLUO_LOCUS4836 [Penicillium psychrofluorescens]|uniref:uncharacterized protein n=1 Tax=Penicillium psychrofluorescens TaxID=3158075 RepID=UPI003CCE0CF9
MSTNPGPSGGDKPEGFSKYLKRMKTVLRPRSGSKRLSVSSLSGLTGKPSASSAPQRHSMAAAPILSDYSTMQKDKAHAVFAKYGLNLESGERKSPTDLPSQRVTKPVRMRVRRSCHRCQTTFGPEKVCVNCQHPRCQKCPRSPPARTKDESASAEPPIPKAKLPEILRQRGDFPMNLASQMRTHSGATAFLTRPSPKGGQDVVRKSIRQRVRRHCHQCETLFAAGSKECEKCKHVRCKTCPRDPAKPEKYPHGYPGDVDPPKHFPNREWKKPRRRYRYICHVCSTTYHDGAPSCIKCGQSKCEETIRDPPKKIKKEFDPALIRHVEERLVSLAV